MRNLKRALSLTLASVMLLGMMVVGAGAAGFPDVDNSNDNVEAIEVLQAIEVMVGNADTGNFEPDRSVTRTEMAVVMANLLKLDYKYYEASCDFWDVPTWARPYVGACYANKIVSGYGDGTYGALDAINPVQAASMMMRALGYFQYSEDYKDGFETATVRQGTQIGIFEGIGSSADKEMTRGQVARMALNALESEMVTFTGTPGSTYTTSTGESITVGYVAKYEPRTSTELKYKAIEDRTSDASLDSNHRGQYYIQLGEELYNGKLTKKYARDDFMRPSINWQYDGKDIGTYVDYELKTVEYKEGVKYATLYDELTYTTIDLYDLDRYEDGVDTNEVKNNFYRANNSSIGGKGALTEVFVDQSRQEITITTINTWLAQANSDYSANSESVSMKLYDSSSSSASAKSVNYHTKSVDSKEVPEAADVKKGEFRLVYLSGKDTNSTLRNYATYEVVDMFDTEMMAESTVTKFSIDGKDGDSNRKVVSKLTTGGTEYSANCKAFYNFGGALEEYDGQLLTNMTYNIFMDRYGNVMGVELAEGTKNYVFITGYDRSGSHISVKTATANAIFLDGTMDTITVNITDTNANIDRADGRKDNVDGTDYFKFWDNRAATTGETSENRWYTYTVNANNVYTLKPVTRMFATDYNHYNATTGAWEYREGKILDSANLYVDDNGTTTWDGNTQISSASTRAYGEDASIYITVDTDKVDMALDGITAITKVNGVYTGIQDVKMEIIGDTVGKGGKVTVGPQGHVPNAVYTMYDSDNYIIASIVVGEAQGATGNYAYILGNAKSERFEASDSARANDGTYYWEFDAFYQGEKVTLTAKTKYPSSTMLNPYTVQELRFDGDYVTNVVDVKASKLHTDNRTNEGIDSASVYDVGQGIGGWTSGSAWGSDPYVHENEVITTGHTGTDSGRLSGNIYLQGRTLYVGTGSASDVGLALARDAKALLVQRENGSLETRAYSTVDEAVSNIADKLPNVDGTQFRGRIVGVLDSRGVAQWVVIISDTELTAGNRPNYDYNGKTYDLYLNDSLSNTIWGGGAGRNPSYVYTRPNDSRSDNDWVAVTAEEGSIVNQYNVYKIKSGYQVRIVDRDITSANAFLMEKLDGTVVNLHKLGAGKNALEFQMPSYSVRIWDNEATTYTFSGFDVALNQPIKLGEYTKAEVEKIEITPRGTQAATRAGDPVLNITIKAKAAVGKLESGKLVVEVTWDIPEDDYHTYKAASTVTVNVSDGEGGKQTDTVSVQEGAKNLTGKADTTKLAGPVVLTGTVSEGNVSVGEMSYAENAQAKEYGFLIVNDSDKLLATGEIEEAEENDSITVTVEKDSGIEENNKITIGETELTVGKDGTAYAETESPEPVAEPTVKFTAATLHDAGEQIADDKLYKAGSYNVTGTKAGETYNVTISVEDLVQHTNGQNKKGAWVGFFMEPSEGWTMKITNSSGTAVDVDKTDGIYFDAAAKDFSTTRTLTLTKGAEKFTYTVKVDLSDVKYVESAPAEKPEVKFTPATLADTKNEVEGALYKDGSYKVNATKTENGYTVAIEAEDLVEHTNAADPQKKGAWVGFFMDAPEGWTMKITNSSNTAVDVTKEDGVYFNKSEENFSKVRTLTLSKEGEDTVTYTITVNLDGVKVKAETTTPAG